MLRCPCICSCYLAQPAGASLSRWSWAPSGLEQSMVWQWLIAQSAVHAHEIAALNL